MIIHLTRSFNKFNLINQKLTSSNKIVNKIYNISNLSTNSSQTDSSETKTDSNNSQQQQQPQSNDEVKLLQEKLKKYETDLTDCKDRLLRALADAENTRNRMRKQVDDAKIFGIQGFSKDLLEVSDVLNLAIKNTDPAKNENNSNDLNQLKEQLNAMFKGLVMTESCLLKIFEKHGLFQINPKDGDKFDPNLHEAIFRIPIPDKQSGTVNVVTKVGYRLNERVLRAAQVGVVQ
jgi:molecular chaperone GrpE